jgi:hypothetical protein
MSKLFFTSKLSSLILAIGLTGLIITSAHAQRSGKGRSRSLSILVVKIGEASLERTVIPVSTAGARSNSYSVNHHEIISGKLVGSVPQGLHLHPLVRREGAERWEVQPAVFRNSAVSESEWKAEVRFGDQTDSGETFELSIVASREPLPVGTLPPDILSRNSLSMSEVVRVRRKIEGVNVWIARINNRTVYGSESIDVKLQAPVEVRARALPAEAAIGVAVHPVKPWTDRHWVMDTAVMSTEGNITAHFGRLGLDEFDEFEVVAFVTWKDEFPQRAVGIPQSEWERIESSFLTKSRVVRVIRWEGELTILEIDGKKVIPGFIIPVDQQSDVYGGLGKPLGQNEKVWLICLPKVGEPWVAGWTNEIHSAGRWVVNVAQLSRDGQSRIVDLVAVIAADDPTKVNPPDLRRWIYQAKRPLKSVRIAVSNSRGR